MNQHATAVLRYDTTNKIFVPFIDAADFGITNSIVSTFGPDGLYYMADSNFPDSQFRGHVYRYDPRAGKFLGVFATVQSGYFPGTVDGVAFSGAHLAVSKDSSGESVHYQKIFRGFTLEQSDSMDTNAIWSSVQDPGSEIGMELVVTNLPSSSQRFYRLRH